MSDMPKATHSGTWVMEEIKTLIENNIPEVKTWRIKSTDSATISNPDNNILNGLYENYVIAYIDKYDAEYYEIFSFKDGVYFGRESIYRKNIDPMALIRISDSNGDVYRFCAKNKNEKQNDTLIFELLSRGLLNKNTHIRDYVKINKQEEKYPCYVENHASYMSNTKITIHDKVFLRSIVLLAKSMVNEEYEENRKCTADNICELIEDYIADEISAKEQQL